MSETTNLKLFKHDNPSTNTNPFDVEQALNDNWDKLDTAVKDLQDDVEENNTNIDTRLTELETDLGTAKTNITNIQAEQTTQNDNIEKNIKDITDLQAENANLKAQIPTGTAAGEEISLSDSAEMELVDFGLQGNSKQETREGYNLIDVTTLTNEAKAKDISCDEDFFVKDSSPDSDNRAWSYSQCNWRDITLKAGTYTLALLFSSQIKNTGADKYLQIFDNNSSSIAIAENNLITNKDIFVQEFTLSQDNTIGIEIKAYDGVYRIMLLEGTYTTENIPEFEEYGAMPSLDYSSEVEAVGDSGSVEIVKSNKNILDFGNQTGNGISIDKNRIIIINPTASITASACNLLNNNFVSGKTLNFTFIANGTVVGEQNLQVLFRTNKNAYKVQQQYSSNNYSNDISKLKKTFADDEIINQIYIYATSSNTNLTIDVQVEISDEATEVVEHEGNTYTIPVQKPFYKIGNYSDSFVKQDEKWYEQHFIKELILNGNEDIRQSTEVNRFYIVDTSLAKILTDESTKNCLSNYFKGVNYYSRWTENCISAREYTITFCTKENYTLEQFKAKLQELYNAGTPVKVYYVLATPELIECTEEQTAVLEQIIKDGTYKEITHFYTTDDLKPNMNVKYYKDLETLFKNQASMQETLNNVQAQILELGGN